MLAEAEIEREPLLLSRERSKAATLLQGAVDRSDIYEAVELSLDRFIAQNLGQIEIAAREIRRAEAGGELAAEEEKRGRKSEEEYAEESAVRIEERAKAMKQEEARKRKDDELNKLRAKEAEKKKELELLRSADEERKKREAHRLIKKEGEAERKERNDKLRDEYERKKDLEREKYKVRDGVGRPDSSTPQPHAPSSSTSVTKLDEKAIEEAALELLLREGRELAAKNGPSKPERDEPECRDPPLRPYISPPKGPAADRHKFAPKTEYPTPKLGYSNTRALKPMTPDVCSATAPSVERSRSPYGYQSSHRERSLPVSPHREQSRSVWKDEDARQADLDHKAEYKKKMSAQREAESELYKARVRGVCDETEYRSRSVTKDRDGDRSKQYEYDYNYGREKHYRHDERSRSRDRDRDRSCHEERSRDYADRRSERPRPRTDEAPEHIDRYVPGDGNSARERDRRDHRSRDEDRYRKRDRDVDEPEYRSKDRDRHREERTADKYRESKYRDDDYEEEKYRDEKHKDDRGDKYRDDKCREEKYREDKYRDREHEKYDRTSSRYEDRSRRESDHTESRRDRPSRDPAPKSIDRYIPGT